jgi:NADH:ubiquinone oxidoreductase subunit 6 (subunit J)
MTAVTIITYVLAIGAALSAATVLVVKEVFHAALLLIICLLCVAGIFVTFNAEFLAVVQLIVYAGGVLILVIFGIMLTVRTNVQLQDTSQNRLISAIIGISLMTVFVYALGHPVTSSIPGLVGLSPEQIGILLMTRFAVPFELAGVLLLISLVGAIVAATNVKKI